ncbi:Retrovirus-related Pol polyprotein from transposon TNT 1-94 [Sparassis crispa]|uniref:Retrovirus-related Pol polyprotein from transposon TNT 1-94 n=1 Tax=Sparassis crispa TaxID=139825 RepID=A0A401H3G4_9APHY|nr:Retrovirus-related Pol polyprotein from transposon TNT 1-94 [Sparassis crispa]GBE88951.1 Retrovirus-related Pol polyprotein from transposon TNT 1-94 [Sparassis crispa]
MSLTSESHLSHLNIVPKLAADGSNWITYKERMFTVMGSRGLLRHLQGTARRPPNPPPFPMPSPAQAAMTASMTPATAVSTTATTGTGTTTTSATTTPAARQAQSSMTPEEYLKTVEAAEQKLDEYVQKEYAARQQIYGTISDQLLLRVKKLGTAVDVWLAVQNEYESKSDMYSGALRTRLQNTKCEEGADVRAHLDTLAKMREELASMGAPISDADFSAHVFASLPETFSPLLQALSTAARVAKTTLSADDLLASILEEHDRRKAHLKPESALSVKADMRSRSRSKSRGRGAKSKDMECYNCGRKGHFSRDCWREGGGKEGQGPKDQSPKKDSSGSKNAKGKPAANAAVGDSATDHAFTATFDSTALAAKPSEVKVEVYDSGATRHMSPYRDAFVTFKAIGLKPITAADGRKFHATGEGTMRIEIPNGDQSTTVMLEDVLYAPEIAFALIPIARADTAGYSTTFENGECRLYSRRHSRTIGRIPSTNGLYKVEHPKSREVASVAEESKDECALVSLSVMDFHRRMGHIAPAIAEHLVCEGRVKGIQLTDKASPDKNCESCIQAKITRQPVPKEREGGRAKELGDRIHSDVWGPARTETLGGKRYFTSFTDDATRWTDLYLLRVKSGTFSAYKLFEARLKTQDGKAIKALQSDRGGEYLSQAFKDHLEVQGTISRLTVHDTPQHNGLAERINRTLPEHARAMLITAELPKSLWGEALMHAMWLKNRTSTRALDGKTPYEARYGKLPDLHDLHEFGAKVWVRIEDADKLESKARAGRFVGYSDESKGYCVYWPEKRSVSVERNVRFINQLIVADEAQPEGAKETVVLTSPATPSAPAQEPEYEPRTSETQAAPPATSPTASLTPSSDAAAKEPASAKSDSESGTGHSQRARKASAYVKRLNDGSGIMDGRKRQLRTARVRKMNPSLQCQPHLQCTKVKSRDPSRKPCKARTGRSGSRRLKKRCKTFMTITRMISLNRLRILTLSVQNSSSGSSTMQMAR